MKYLLKMLSLVCIALSFSQSLGSTLQGKDIVIHEYIYDDTYPAFKAGTNEKEITARLNQAFNNNLKQHGAVFTKDNIKIKVADIACGPADTVIKYLDNINAIFDIRVTDYNPVYAGNGLNSKTGQAYYNLQDAQINQRIPIVNFSVSRGDGFSGTLNTLLSCVNEQKQSKIKPNTFQLVYFSHGMYHASGKDWEDKSDTILCDISNRLLDYTGIGVMYHVAPSLSNKKTFQYFRSKYGNTSSIESRSDTEKVDNPDPTAFIYSSCKKQKIPVFELDFSAKLFFSDKVKDNKEILKNPNRYNELFSIQDINDYNKLSFIVQRASVEMLKDKSSTGLEAYIDEIIDNLQQDDNGMWYLNLQEKMQVILHPMAPPKFKKNVENALRDTENQLQVILDQAEKDYQSR